MVDHQFAYEHGPFSEKPVKREPSSCTRSSWWSGFVMAGRSGWWFGTWIFWLSIYWECHNPNWLYTLIFFRGVKTTNQRFLGQTPSQSLKTHSIQRLDFPFPGLDGGCENADRGPTVFTAMKSSNDVVNILKRTEITSSMRFSPKFCRHLM